MALNPNEIIEHFNGPKDLLLIESHKSVASTNDSIKPLFQKHPHHISLVAASEQTAGRGRRDKPFFSSLDHGLYFSLALMPNTKKIEEIPLYTLLTAAALGRTLETILDEPIAVKWVNDIFYQKRKVAGILSEMLTRVENNKEIGIVIGVGINLAGDFGASDEAVQTVAGTLFGRELPKTFNESQFLGNFLTHFWHHHHQFHKKDFMSYYDARLMGKGKEVSYQVNGEEKKGIIKGINEHGHLLVKEPNETIDVLYGQEVHFGSHQFL